MGTADGYAQDKAAGFTGRTKNEAAGVVNDHINHTFQKKADRLLIHGLLYTKNTYYEIDSAGVFFCRMMMNTVAMMQA